MVSLNLRTPLPIGAVFDSSTVDMGGASIKTTERILRSSIVIDSITKYPVGPGINSPLVSLQRLLVLFRSLDCFSLILFESNNDITNQNDICHDCCCSTCEG